MSEDNGGRLPSAPGSREPSQQAVSAANAASIPSADWRDACDLEGVCWPVSGFAPGHYMGSCRVCGDTVVNIDKRASQCLRCAINSLASAFEGIDRAFRIRVWNDAKRAGLSDRAAMEKITEARAQAMSAGTAETPKVAQGEARQRGPKDAPEPSPGQSTPSSEQEE